MTTEEFYNKVYQFCENEGLIEQLKKSFELSEAELFEDLDITKNGLDILDAVHCVHDKNRTLAFLKGIELTVKENDFVVEAGLGTGILSLFAAHRGAKVLGIELNKDIYNLAMELRSYLIDEGAIQENNVNFVNANAIDFEINQEVDLIISENLYTGMFFEKQVEIMNGLLKYLKQNGKVIPQKMDSYLALCEAKFPHSPSDREMFAPSVERNTIVPAKKLTNEHMYSSLDFRKKIDPQIKFDNGLSIKEKGLINGIFIYSEVEVVEGVFLKCNDTVFLNSEIIISISDAIPVNVGQRIQLFVQYICGQKPVDAEFILSQTC